MLFYLEMCFIKTSYVENEVDFSKTSNVGFMKNPNVENNLIFKENTQCRK